MENKSEQPNFPPPPPPQFINCALINLCIKWGEFVGVVARFGSDTKMLVNAAAVINDDAYLIFSSYSLFFRFRWAKIDASFVDEEYDAVL